MLLPNDKSEDPESSSIKPFDLLGTEGCSRGRDLFILQENYFWNTIFVKFCTITLLKLCMGEESSCVT